MTPATRVLLEALLRHAKGAIVEIEKWVKAQDSGTTSGPQVSPARDEPSKPVRQPAAAHQHVSERAGV